MADAFFIVSWITVPVAIGPFRISERVTARTCASNLWFNFIDLSLWVQDCNLGLPAYTNLACLAVRLVQCNADNGRAMQNCCVCAKRKRAIMFTSSTPAAIQA
jgi:hypothetical protein